MSITESTRDGIRKLVVSALTDGLTVDELSTALEDAYQFSDVRAETIARTELGNAHVEGTLTAWKDSGLVTGKRWLTADDDVDDECGDNEAEEVIDIDDLFSSGDDGPPAHPNCRCVLVSSLKPPSE
jgi:SPP1 gp7 family putative phage head morphogenesis protein